MKKCPFCAEEIQDDAIRCKHCRSDLDAGAVEKLSPKQEPEVEKEPAPPPPKEEARVLLYQGSPSWRAFFWHHVAAFGGAPLVGAAVVWIAGRFDASNLARAVAFCVPLALGALYYLGLRIYRKSIRVRVSNRSIEVEEGIFSKRIDVAELWRVKDVRYRQSLLDRILKVAHIDVFTKDVTTPTIGLVGLPASRQLFEKLRDSIEIQRQSRRVLGLME